MLALKIFKVKRKKQGQRSHFVAEVDVKDKRMFCRSDLSDVFCKKGALKYLTKLPGKHMYRSLFLKKVSVCRPATLFKMRLMHSLFSKIFKFLGNFSISSEQLFYGTPVNHCLWFNWILVNFDHHSRFTQMPENFEHHSWF